MSNIHHKVPALGAISYLLLLTSLCINSTMLPESPGLPSPKTQVIISSVDFSRAWKVSGWCSNPQHPSLTLIVPVVQVHGLGQCAARPFLYSCQHETECPRCPPVLGRSAQRHMDAQAYLRRLEGRVTREESLHRKEGPMNMT